MDMEDLARRIGVSRRTLFYAFRRSIDLGPRRFFEVSRLHALRRALLDGDPAELTVTQTALEFGFTDPGRMAGRYAGLFGCYPSDDLARGSGCTA